MNTINYNPPPGTHILKACLEAITLAHENQANVQFQFNDIIIVATPDSTVSELETRYTQACERAREEYKNSPRGIYEANRRREEIQAKRAGVEKLISTSQFAFKSGLDNTIAWIMEFAPLADDVEVSFDKQVLLVSLTKAGFVVDKWVGTGPKAEWSKKMMGEYIVGQVMSCLASGMPPHQVCVSFGEKYFKMCE